MDDLNNDVFEYVVYCYSYFARHLMKLHRATWMYSNAFYVIISFPPPPSFLSRARQFH